MRLLEILLVLVLLASLVESGWAMQRPSVRPRARRRVLFLPFTALFLFLLHLLIEKMRWQMAPAYGLALLLPALALMRVFSTAKPLLSPRSCTAQLQKVLGHALAFVLLGTSVLLSSAAPVFQLPAPEGPFAIGVQDFYLVDAARPERFTDDPADHRELVLRAWYPAHPPAGAASQPYWPEVERTGPRILQFLGLPDFLLNYMSLVKSHAYPGAPMPAGLARCPVLVFSHGYGMDDLAGHQAVLEELASRGYIVISLSHLYESLAAELPDGRIILIDPRAYNTINAGAPGAPRLTLDDQLNTWVEDGFFVLNQLERFQSGDIPSAFAGRMDLQKIGVFGFSFGGAMSAEICLRDSRCKAGANMDGSQFGYADFNNPPLRAPFLFFYNESSAGMNDQIYNRVENWAYRVTIRGATHSNFTDKVLWSPLMGHLRALPAIGAIPFAQAFGPIDAQQITRIQRAYLLAFFDRHLQGADPALLKGPGAPFPEVDYQFRAAP